MAFSPKTGKTSPKPRKKRITFSLYAPEAQGRGWRK